MVHEIRVCSLDRNDSRSKELLQDIYTVLNINSVKKVRVVKVFRFEGIEEEEVKIVADKLLSEQLTSECQINAPIIWDTTKRIEIAYKPGVMNPEISTLLKAATELGINLKAADTSIEYFFYGDITANELEMITQRLLLNETVEHQITFKPATLINDSLTQPPINFIKLSQLNDNELVIISRKMQLALNLEEMKRIQNYFMMQQREPTDAELETIAQTWSEHCYHKTFKADLIVDGISKKPLFTRLKETASKYQTNVISAFEDNAGAFKFYDDYAILAKVETHNSPSAIEPYGGAATGSGGVFRDIMGTGQGAKIIASTDMFCFAPPDTPADEIPAGCLHPNYLLKRVVAGVRDYGNRMGIPTNNGSLHFHEDFKAKPTVIVGAYGIAPIHYAKKGKPCKDDLIVIIGGRTGRDGIHGATFSSVSMTHQTMHINATAVQIGNPIEEKKVSDAVLECRNKNLVRAITDCGAGGLSSAIGEMGSDTGVHVQLEKVPLKYHGLAPWEIWVSESQERMVCAVSPYNQDDFIQACANWNVEATVIGYFSDDKQLKVFNRDEMVCILDMAFLHNGIPQTLIAEKPVRPSQNSIPFGTASIDISISELFKSILVDWNVCSREAIVRQYDHTVQGTNALLPYSGVNQEGPNDAAVLTPILGKSYGLVIGHGINPILNRIDSYAGSLWAIVEALSNVAAVGGNIDDAALIDNFIWPTPDSAHLWMLNKAMEACINAMNIFKIPFISGKDSLSSTYRFNDGSLLHIPPVLCISAMSKIPNVYKTVSSNFKKSNSYIVLLGQLDTKNFAGSLAAKKYPDYFCNSQLPNLNVTDLPKRFAFLYSEIAAGSILSCHDISEGGLAVTVAEMCFGSKYGARIDLSYCETGAQYILFSETAGCFVVEISEDKIDQIADAQIPVQIIGRTTADGKITIMQDGKTYFAEFVRELRDLWKSPMKGVFH